MLGQVLVQSLPRLVLPANREGCSVSEYAKTSKREETSKHEEKRSVL